MLVSSVEILYVEVEFAFLDQRLQELLNQLRLKVPDSRHLEFCFVDQISA